MKVFLSALSLFEPGLQFIKVVNRWCGLFFIVPSVAFAAYVPAYTILNDAKEIEVQSNGSYVRTVERSIRIEMPQGIDQYGQAKLYYDAKRNKLEILDAYTVRPSGERLTVTPDRIKRLNASTEDVAPYFSDQMMAVIIFPQVEVGSQLYYKVVLEDFDPVVKNRFGAKVAYTPHRKYETASIRVTHPADMAMNVYSRGVVGNKVVLADGRTQYHYQYQQSEAFPFEPGQIEFEDFSPVVQFSNYADYADLAKVTQSLFQPKAQVTPKIQRLADEQTQGLKAPRQKAQRLYDWVSKNIRYVGIDVGASGFEPHFADEILEHGYGDCKDHATILEALLLAVGVPSSPVLINTAESYLLPQLAGNNYFNHVITYVPDFDLYLDSTAQFAEFGTLPPEDMGKPTLVTQTGKIGATPNSSSKTDYTITHTKLRMLSDGSVVGGAKYEPHGYYTTNSRVAQFSYENRETQSVVDSVLARFQETGTGTMDHGDPTDLSTAWSVTSQFKLDPVINLPGPSAFVLPVGIAPGYIKDKANTKPYEGRHYPFSCGSSRNVEETEISFPNNVHITRIPKGMDVRTKEQAYKSSYRLVGNKIFVRRELTTDVGTDVCKPSPGRYKDQVYLLNRVKADLRNQVFLE